MMFSAERQKGGNTTSLSGVRTLAVLAVDSSAGLYPACVRDL